MKYIAIFCLLVVFSGHADSNAIDAYEKLTKTHPRFYAVQIELIKYYYQQKKWDQFFARLYYLKSVYPHLSLPPYLLTLEAMALSRLCYFKEALLILNNYKTQALKEGQELPSYVIKAENFMVTSLRLGGIDRAPKETFSAFGLVSKDAFWQINTVQLFKLDSPRLLRMNIQGRCEQ